MTFDEAFDALLGNEGAYSFNAVDPGGETMWGITARVARANGYTGEMRALPRETAKDLYRRLYWNAARCDDLPAALRFDVFDAAVNSGVAQAAEWLQEALGVTPDGAIGPVTLAAASQNPELACRRFNGRRLLFMTYLPTWGAFGKGWARRIGNNLLKD